MTPLHATPPGVGSAPESPSAGVSRTRAFEQTFAANLVLAGLNAATGILAARLLGPSGRGQLAAVQLWPTFLATVAILGLPDALVYFTSTDRARAGRYLASATALALGGSAVAMAVGYPLLGAVLHDRGEAVVAAARVYLLVCPLFVLAGLPFHTLRGVGAFGVWNAIRVAPSVVWLGILVVAALDGSPHPLSLPRWHLVGLALLVVPVVLLTARRLHGPYRPEVSLARPMLRYGIPGMVAAVPQQLNLRLDQMLMAAFLPARNLGLYVAAVAWSSAVSPLVTAVGTVLFPSVAAQPDAAGKAAVLARGSRMAVLLTVAAAVVVGPLTWPGVKLVFGADFGPAVPAAVVLVVAAGIVGYGFVLQEALRGLGLPRAVLSAEVLGLVASLAGLAVLLPLFGILGAALASASGYSVVVVALLRQVRRATGLGVVELLRPTGDEVAALVAGAARLTAGLRPGKR